MEDTETPRMRKYGERKTTVCTYPPPSGHSPSIGSSTGLPEPCQVQIHHISHTLSYFIHLPMKMELVECSETSAIRTQTPGNYPKENTLHIEHGESLKSRNLNILFYSYMAVVPNFTLNWRMPDVVSLVTTANDPHSL